jgi:hypothetical protein
MPFDLEMAVRAALGDDDGVCDLHVSHLDSDHPMGPGSAVIEVRPRRPDAFSFQVVGDRTELFVMSRPSGPRRYKFFYEVEGEQEWLGEFVVALVEAARAGRVERYLTWDGLVPGFRCNGRLIVLSNALGPWLKLHVGNFAPFGTRDRSAAKSGGRFGRLRRAWQCDVGVRGDPRV